MRFRELEVLLVIDLDFHAALEATTSTENAIRRGASGSYSLDLKDDPTELVVVRFNGNTLLSFALREELSYPLQSSGSGRTPEIRHRRTPEYRGWLCQLESLLR